MKKKDRDRNGDERTEGVELEESRRQRNCGGEQEAEKGNQIQKRAHDPQRYGSLHSENHKYHRRTCGHGGSDDKVPQHKPADHIAKIPDKLGDIDFGFEHVHETNGHPVFCDQHEKHQEGKDPAHNQDTGYRSDASNQIARPVRWRFFNRDFGDMLRTYQRSHELSVFLKALEFADKGSHGPLNSVSVAGKLVVKSGCPIIKDNVPARSMKHNTTNPEARTRPRPILATRTTSGSTKIAKVPTGVW